MVFNLEKNIFDFQVSRYMTVAATTLWVYDYTLTIADEVELLWSRNGIMIKILYLVGRYIPIVGIVLTGNNMLPTWQHTPSVTICRVTYVIAMLSIATQNVVSMVIFTIRISTIYLMRPRIRRFLFVSLFVTIVALLVFHVFFFIKALPGMTWLPLPRTCATFDFQTWSLGAIYVAPIFMESLIFLATLFHAFDQQRSKLKGMKTSTGAILNRLYVDGTQYYLLVVLFRLGEVLTFYLAPVSLLLLFYQFEYLASSTLTSRFFLSFRRTLINSNRVVILDGTTEMTDGRITQFGAGTTEVVNFGKEEFSMTTTGMTEEQAASYRNGQLEAQ